MSLQNSDYAWRVAASAILAILATIASAAHGILSVAFSLVPQSVVLLVLYVLNADIDRWSVVFRVSVCVAAFIYYLAVLVLPGTVVKSVKARIAMSLAVHVALSLIVFWCALFQWQR